MAGSAEARSRVGEGVACPVCASGDVGVWYPADVEDPEQVSFSYTFSPRNSRTFQVLRCRACTHSYCWPVPADLEDRYRDVVDEEYLRHETSRTLSAEAVLRALRRWGRGPRLLDVGCATGDLLGAARRLGYEPEGLELSDWSSRLARQRGLRVHQERLETLARRLPQAYDLVTLMGVIEHFSSPRVEMEHVKGLLRPGGVVAIWTGDVDSVLSRVLGRRWWYWQGQHVQYFTRRSLLRLIDRTGLEFVASRLYPFAATMGTVANSLRRYRAHPLLTRLVRPAFALKPVWFLRLPGEMLVLARRPPSGESSRS